MGGESRGGGVLESTEVEVTGSRRDGDVVCAKRGKKGRRRGRSCKEAVIVLAQATRSDRKTDAKAFGENQHAPSRG
jgi:hypothetical protein